MLHMVDWQILISGKYCLQFNDRHLGLLEHGLQPF